MEFKKGDKVFVSAKSASYGGKYAGMVGTVTYIDPRSRKNGVKFHGEVNPLSDYGWFYFYPVELVHAPEEYSLSDRAVVSNPFTIKKVYFNNPVTVVLWADGTKTIVRCQEDDFYDPEMGLAMAISKKALGNKGNYYNTFKKYLPKYEEAEAVESDFLREFWRSMCTNLYR